MNDSGRRWRRPLPVGVLCALAVIAGACASATPGPSKSQQCGFQVETGADRLLSAGNASAQQSAASSLVATYGAAFYRDAIEPVFRDAEAVKTSSRLRQALALVARQAVRYCVAHDGPLGPA